MYHILRFFSMIIQNESKENDSKGANFENYAFDFFLIGVLVLEIVYR